jgi:hypothetical protein
MGSEGRDGIDTLILKLGTSPVRYLWGGVHLTVFPWLSNQPIEAIEG